jgi:hypothetical protein
VVAVIRSPLLGSDGNVEFLVHCRKGATPLPTTALDAVAAVPPAEAEERGS